MRKALAIGISALTLIGSVVPSEARGFRMRSFGHVAANRGPVAAPGLAVMPGFTLRTDSARSANPTGTGSLGERPVGFMTAEALAPGEAGLVKIAMPAPAAAPLKKDPQPWCRTGRLAGSGSGFCLIN